MANSRKYNSCTAYELFTSISRAEFKQNHHSYEFSFQPHFGKILKLTGANEEHKMDFIMTVIVEVLCWNQNQNAQSLEIALVISSHTFKVQNLVSALEIELINRGKEDVEELTKAFLKRVHLFKCDNAEELLTSLYKLKQFCFENNKMQFFIQNIDYLSWNRMGENRNKKYNTRIVDLLKDITKNYLLHSIIVQPVCDGFDFNLHTDNAKVFESVFN